MAIDGLILLNSTGLVGPFTSTSPTSHTQQSHPVIQSGFRSTSPAYPLIHIDAYNTALSKVSRPDDIDPVIHVPSYNNTPSACCHVQCSDMRFLCPISGNGTSFFFQQMLNLYNKMKQFSRSFVRICIFAHFYRHPTRILWQPFCSNPERQL